MLGLLYKDFFSAKKELLISLVVMVLFVVYNLILGQVELLGPTIGVLVSLGSMMPTYSLYYDKTCGWNKFICASPISRTKVILSKYLAGVASLAIFAGIIMLNNLAAGSPISSWIVLLLILVMLFIQSVMLPVSLKLGQNVVVVVFLLMVFLPTGLLFALNKAGIWSDEAISAAFDFVQKNAALLAPIGIIAVLVLYVGSFLLTNYLYKHMEF